MLGRASNRLAYSWGERELVDAAQVVDEEWEVGRGTDLLVVREDRVRRMGIVNGPHGRNGIGPDSGGVVGEGHGVHGGAGPDVDHDRDASRRGLDGGFGNGAALCRRQQQPLPGRAADVQAAQSLPGEQVGQLLDDCQRRLAVFRERSQHGRPDAAERGLHEHAPWHPIFRTVPCRDKKVKGIREKPQRLDPVGGKIVERVALERWTNLVVRPLRDRCFF
jgi:hypothetical protein